MRILIVEDEENVGASIRDGLVDEGYAVDLATDGKSGLWYSRENTYDAVVLDIMLPELDGVQVCSVMREGGDWTPVIMLTARDGDNDQTLALDSGADDYLTKPFSMAVLKAHLRAIIRRGAVVRPVEIIAGVIRIQPARHRIYLDSEEIGLTAREFAVIEYLSRYVNDVRSKLEILANVWDYNFDGDPNIVEVYIRRLRRKLDLPLRGTDIVTIRGAGYRLEVAGGEPDHRH